MKILYLSVLGFLLTTNNLTGYEIVKSFNNNDKPDNIKSYLTMKSHKNGKARTSKFISWSKNNGEFQLMWFIEPRQYKGMSFLSINNNMTMWLPAYKKIRKVSPKNKKKSFMNSDLTYADFDVRDIDMYTYKKSSKFEVIDSVECYIVTSTPKDMSKEIYSKHETWFSIKDLIPIKEISFDKNGEVFKEKMFSYSPKDGMDLVKTLTIRNIQKGTYTTLFIDSIKLNTELDKNYFKEKNLKRIPK